MSRCVDVPAKTFLGFEHLARIQPPAIVEEVGTRQMYQHLYHGSTDMDNVTMTFWFLRYLLGITGSATAAVPDSMRPCLSKKLREHLNMHGVTLRHN